MKCNVTVNVAINVPVDNKKNAFFGVPFEGIIWHNFSLFGPQNLHGKAHWSVKMLRHDKYCPEKGSRGVNRPKICQNVSKKSLILVSKTEPPKRIFLIINRYDYCNEYSTRQRGIRAVRIAVILKGFSSLLHYKGSLNIKATFYEKEIKKWEI